MKADLKQYTVREIVEGFVYNELEGKGLYGLAGKLVIQPEYQRSMLFDHGRLASFCLTLGHAAIMLTTSTSQREPP